MNASCATSTFSVTTLAMAHFAASTPASSIASGAASGSPAPSSVRASVVAASVAPASAGAPSLALNPEQAPATATTSTIARERTVTGPE
jgi:hypothetical protein